MSTPDSDEVEVRNEVLALLNVGGLEIGLARFVGSLLALPSSDLAALPGRIRSMQYLFHFETPFHTLAELTDRLVAFRAFDDEVREYLLRTGLQPKPFAASPWFDRMLGRLYGTRCTSRPFPFPRKPPYQFLRCGDPYNPKTLAYKACKCEDASFLTAC